MQEQTLKRAMQTPPDGNLRRLCLRIDGAVQGVGFRPFFYRLATEMGLAGWVSNDTQGLLAEVEGQVAALEAFLQRLEQERPPNAQVQHVEKAFREPAGYTSFDIRASTAAGAK